jgi:hypothetical protein
VALIMEESEIKKDSVWIDRKKFRASCSPTPLISRRCCLLEKPEIKEGLRRKFKNNEFGPSL